MTTCPHCGAQILRPSMRFCSKCGKALNAQQPPAAPTPDPANGVCINGHAQARPNARFCYICRAPVTPPLAAQPSAVPNPANGVCANGHPQVRPNARFCYVCCAPVNPPIQPPVPTGPTFNGRYQVIGELGRGGMGSVVYKVQDLQNLGRVLALKEVDETLLQPAKDRPELVKAFQREAELLQRLDHPNIVNAYDYFQIGDKHYLAMDFVQGRMLESILENSPGGFPESRVLPWIEQLCDALGYLHGQNPPIIYRDMKPANVMVEDGTNQIKLIDFGIAREYKGGKKKGDTTKFGTPGYAAPEVTSSKETCPASDVYSLGAMLYELLTGDDPGRSPFSFFNKTILVRPPISASSRVVDAIERAVELDMGKRFQTMAEFHEALTGQAVPTPQPKPQKKSSSPAPQAGQASQVPSLVTPPSFPSLVSVPPRAVGALQISTAQLDLGRVEKGGLPPASQSFTVTLSGGGQAQVTASDGWLIATPSSVGNGQSVEVSVRTEMLTLGQFNWSARNIVKPVFAMALAAAIGGWYISVPVLIAGIWWRWIWQLLGLVLGGTLGLQLTMWLVSWLLPRTAVKAQEHKGQVVVSDGATHKAVTVQAKAVPSAWRQLVGWGTLALATAAEAGLAAFGVWWLVEWLGWLWR